MPKARRSKRLHVTRNVTNSTRRNLSHDSEDDFIGEDCSTRNMPSTSRRGRNKESESAKKRRSGIHKTKMSEKPRSQGGVLNIEPDDEISEPDLPKDVVDNITNKVKNFFEGLENKEDKKLFNSFNLHEANNKPQKDKYHIISDSEDELCPIPEVKAESSSGGNSRNATTKLNKGSSDIIIDLDKNVKVDIPTLSFEDFKKQTGALLNDLDSSVGTCEIMGSSSKNATTKLEKGSAGIVIDLDDNLLDTSQENLKVDIPTLSFEDFKRQTEALLSDIDSSVRNCEKIIKPEEPVPKSPVKVGHTCLVCLEMLGDSLKAMSTICGHLFCEPCLKQIIVTTKSCPACRKKLNKTKYHPIYL